MHGDGNYCGERKNSRVKADAPITTVMPQSLQLLYPPLETIIAANHTRGEERNPSGFLLPCTAFYAQANC